LTDRAFMAPRFAPGRIVMKTPVTTNARWAVAAAVVLGLSVPAVAADVLLNGTVTSASGERMGGVTVSAKAEGQTITTTVFTDEVGGYYFPALPAGKYRVWAQAVSFETAKSAVDLNAPRRQDFKLLPINDIERQIRQLPGDLIFAGLPEDTPDDARMKKIFHTNCTSCHTPNYTLQHRFDEAGWNAIINVMKVINVYGFYKPETKPNPIMDFHQAELAKYLAKARGPGESAFRVKSRPRPSGDAARVVFKEYDIPLNPDQELISRIPPNNGTDWTQGTTSRVGSIPHDAAADLDGNLWFVAVAPTQRWTIARVDAKTGEIKSFKVNHRNGMAATAHGLIRDDKGMLWFDVHMPRGVLARIDPRTEKLDVFNQPDDMSAIDGPVTLDFDGKGGIWAGTLTGVLRFDPATEKFVEYKSKNPTTPNGGIGSTYGIAGTADGNAWWTQMAFDTLVKSNVATGQPTEFKLPPAIEATKRVTEADRKFYATYAPTDIGSPLPWNHGPRRIGIDRAADVLWVANSWSGTLTRVDGKTQEMTFVPLPDTFNHQPYHVQPDSQHNVWAPLWTTDQIAKYDTTAKSWTMYDLPTRGTEVRIVNILERGDTRQLVFAYARSSKIASMSFRSEADIAALKQKALP
jgi:streptogramin lyase